MKNNRRRTRCSITGILAYLCACGALVQASDLTVDSLFVTQTSVVQRIFMVYGPPTVGTNDLTFDHSLVLYYGFNTDPGGSTISDESTNGNNGTIVSAVWTSGARSGSGAMAFNGSSGYISIPASTSLHVTNGLTVATWYLSNSSSQQPLIEWNGSGTMGSHLWANVSGHQTWGNFVDIGGASRLVYSGSPGAGQWHHIAATYDRASGAAAIYVDGVLQGQDNLGNFEPLTGLGVYLGYRPSFATLNGMLDEVRIYNRALTAGEVALLGTDGVGTSYTNVVLRATSANVELTAPTLIKELVPQGDISMGPFTSRP